MCFGVRDAIQLAIQQSQESELTIYGELVHNETVNELLRSRGIQVRPHAAEIETPTVMISSHGASDRARAELQARGARIVEATCPLVHFAHRCLRALVADGYHPVIIGRRDHVEVRGLTEDLAEYEVILSDEDVLPLRERPRLGVVSQTTQPIDRVNRLVTLLRWRFPHSEICFKDTVCRPTKLRQAAAERLARQCDTLVVIGAPHSNNTRELAATGRRHCPRVYQIEGPAELEPDWFVHAETVGLTAGTSTPDEVIEAAERQLMAWATPVLTP